MVLLKCETMVNVLITSAGRRNQLIECFRDGARRLGAAIRIVACDMLPSLSSACAVADCSYSVPMCTLSGYLPALDEICRAEKIGIVVPTIDPELVPLCGAREALGRIGVRVISSTDEVVKIAADKFITSEVLSRAGIPTPTTLRLDEYLLEPGRIKGPIIAKPINGSASIGVIYPRSVAELESLPSNVYIVQELWSGDEYTVNMFFDQHGSLRCAVPHRRLEVRSGEVSKGRTERKTELLSAAQRIADVLPGARGPLCFQAIVRPDGTYCVFEINARFGGGYPLAHEAGARFTQWILEEVVGTPTSASERWEEGLTMLRFDNAVFCRGKS